MSSLPIRRSAAAAVPSSSRNTGTVPPPEPQQPAPRPPPAQGNGGLPGKPASGSDAWQQEFSEKLLGDRVTVEGRAGWGKDFANPNVELGASARVPVKEGVEFGVKAGVHLGGDTVDSFGFQDARFGVSLSGRNVGLSTDLTLDREGRLSGTATASGKTTPGKDGSAEGKLEARFGPGMALEQVQGQFSASRKWEGGQASASLEGRMGADGRFQGGSAGFSAEAAVGRATVKLGANATLGESAALEKVQGNLSVGGKVGEHGEVSASVEGQLGGGRLQSGKLTVQGSHRPAENRSTSGTLGVELGEDGRFERLDLQGHAQLSGQTKIDGAFSINREGVGSVKLGVTPGEGRQLEFGVGFGTSGHAFDKLEVKGQRTEGGVTLSADAAVDGTFKLQSAGVSLSTRIAEGTTLGTGLRVGEKGLDSLELTATRQVETLQLEAGVSLKPDAGGLGANLGLSYKPSDDLSIKLEGSLKDDVAKARIGLTWRF